MTVHLFSNRQIIADEFAAEAVVEAVRSLLRYAAENSDQLDWTTFRARVDIDVALDVLVVEARIDGE